MSFLNNRCYDLNKLITFCESSELDEFGHPKPINYPCDGKVSSIINDCIFMVEHHPNKIMFTDIEYVPPLDRFNLNIENKEIPPLPTHLIKQYYSSKF